MLAFDADCFGYLLVYQGAHHPDYQEDKAQVVSDARKYRDAQQACDICLWLVGVAKPT